MAWITEQQAIVSSSHCVCGEQSPECHTGTVNKNTITATSFQSPPHHWHQQRGERPRMAFILLLVVCPYWIQWRIDNECTTQNWMVNNGHISLLTSWIEYTVSHFPPPLHGSILADYILPRHSPRLLLHILHFSHSSLILHYITTVYEYNIVTQNIMFVITWIMEEHQAHKSQTPRHLNTFTY